MACSMAAARSRPLAAFWVSSRLTASVRAWTTLVSAIWTSVLVRSYTVRSCASSVVVSAIDMEFAPLRWRMCRRKCTLISGYPDVSGRYAPNRKLTP
jgi:hypothetical protein